MRPAPRQGARRSSIRTMIDRIAAQPDDQPISDSQRLVLNRLRTRWADEDEQADIADLLTRQTGDRA